MCACRWIAGQCSNFNSDDRNLAHTLAIDEVADLVARLAPLSADAVAQLADSHVSQFDDEDDDDESQSAAATVRCRYDVFSFDHVMLAVLQDAEYLAFFDQLGFAASMKPWSIVGRSRKDDCLVWCIC